MQFKKSLPTKDFAPYPNDKYRISTITATGSVDTEINLDTFYDMLMICDTPNDTELDEDGIVYAEYGKKKSDTVYKGFSKKFLVNKRKVPNKTKRFDNQVTIVYRRTEVLPDGSKSQNLLNIKVFRNGNVQITGIKYINQGSIMVDIIIGILREIHVEHSNVIKNYESLCNKNYKIRLINSDFKIGFPIKRELLFKVFTSNYDNDCTFEPCIYPGVKIQYFYNTTNKLCDGLCHCESTCYIGKGCGTLDGSCKKITIAVFQSGCVIITGAQSHCQIDEAYSFICNILHKHKESIEKMSIIPTEKVQKKEIIMINKKKIIYPIIKV